MKLRKLSVFAILVFAGCVSENLEVLSEDAQVTKINSVHTKSVEDQPYYWHNDEKVFITPTENSYVILRDTGLIDVDAESHIIRLSETDEVSSQSEILVLPNSEEGNSLYGMKISDEDMELLRDEAVVYRNRRMVTSQNPNVHMEVVEENQDKGSQPHKVWYR